MPEHRDCLDAAVRNSDTFTQAGTAQAFPGAQAFEYFSLIQAIAVAGEFPADNLQEAFFATAVNITANPFRTQQITD